MSEVIASAPSTTAVDAAATKGAVAANPVAENKSAAEIFHDIVVDGKPRKVSQKELLEKYPLAETANSRFEQAAQMRKEAESILGRLRNPKDAIKLLSDPKLGLNQAEIVAAMEEWYSDNVIKRSEMSPEQIELADAKERLKKYEEQEKAKEELAKKEEESKADQAEIQRLQQEVIAIMDQSGLPKTSFTAKRIAYWTRINEAKGLNAPASLIVEQVKGELRQVVDSLTQSSEGETLVNLLGEQTVKKLRAFDLERIRKNRQTPKLNQTEADPFTPKRGEKIDLREVKRRMREFK
jgi:hypothetical protein